MHRKDPDRDELLRSGLTQSIAERDIFERIFACQGSSPKATVVKIQEALTEYEFKYILEMNLLRVLQIIKFADILKLMQEAE